MESTLPSWNEGATRSAIVDFVERVTEEGGVDYVPPFERIAVFDNDGTLWCEKPMPIELGFILKRLAEMAEQDATLRDQQPWKAAHEKDYAWLGDTITKHYSGDDSQVKVLIGGILHGFADMTVEAYADAAHAFSTKGSTRPSIEASTTAGIARWSSYCATSRRTSSRTTSSRAVTVTS